MNAAPIAYLGLYALCRLGFENETSQEANDLCNAAEYFGYAQTQPNSGYVRYAFFEPMARVDDRVATYQWIFARQVVPIVAELSDLDTQDRLTPILASVGTLSFADILVETPDTNEGKALSGLAKGLTNAARQKLKQLNRFQEGHRRLPTLHLLLLSGDHILVGVSYPPQSSPYVGGIQHLKLPKDAPSRAILKLEEAAIQLLSRQQREHWMRPGMSAVDLGAAPGGWTWWLTQQGMQVIAIDNANMSDAVMKTGQVEHLRVDGFSWQPRHPAHWICCDMVEQPQRVAQLMARWLTEGWAKAALFNLKLPMKKRYDMVIQCLSLFDHLSDSHSLVAKQLYHDREEITVVLLPRR